MRSPDWHVSRRSLHKGSGAVDVQPPGHSSQSKCPSSPYLVMEANRQPDLGEWRRVIDLSTVEPAKVSLSVFLGTLYRVLVPGHSGLSEASPCRCEADRGCLQ